MNEHDLPKTDRTTTRNTLGEDPSMQMGQPATDLERYLDYAVIDRDDNKVGTVDAVWQDHTGQPAYIGVKTGWLGLGKAHVIPAHAVQVSDATRKIRLPYTTEAVKEAPSFDDQFDIDTDAEQRIASHYSRYGYSWNRGAERELADTDLETSTEREGDTTATGRTTDEDVRMPLSQEEVNIGKRQVDAGGVRLRKIIRTETVNKPVELQQEDIVVERVPATGRQPTRADVAFREEEIYVPLRREEAVVEKTARTTEEVRVGKKRQTERRDIKETVRKEDVEIERKGEANRGTDKPRKL